MVIGGGRIYQECLPQADRLYLTFIDADIVGDTYFPNYEESYTWREIERAEYASDDRNAHNLTFVTLARVG